ncbi:MAG: InlB B-repeat-containing protein, partial [Bacteroidales bacterium]|nr:InlB B-repeat-containing protein [Candidatus Equimonas enterica]
MVSVKVGGNAFGTSQQETAYNNSAYTFEPTTEQSATVYKGVIVVSLNRTSAKKALYVKSIAVTYEDSDEPAKTLSSIAISGTPTKTTYIEGDKFNPAGLVVTGTYSDESTAEITDGITWSFDPETLALGTTSVDITATVDGITSSVYTVNDLTVNEYVQTWANTYTSGDGIKFTTAGTSGSPAKVIWDETEYDAFKSGSSSSTGSCTVTIPANTKILHFHAVGWKGEDVTLTVDGKSTTFNLVADDGVTNNSPFTLQNDPETNDYFTFDPKGATSITLKATSGNRFVLFGVNAEMNEDTDPPIPDFIKTSSINLQVGDDAYDVSECLNIPDDYDTSVYSITTTIDGLTEKDGEYACAYPYLSFQKAGTYTVHVIAAAIEGKYAQTEGDITVEVTAPAPKYLIKWSVNGEIAKTETVEEGSAATAPEVTVPDGYTQKFMGWVTTETVDAETAPAYVTSFDTNADITYYAVFADEVGGSGSGDYKGVTTALTDWSGDYLIAYDKETFADGRI